MTKEREVLIKKIDQHTDKMVEWLKRYKNELDFLGNALRNDEDLSIDDLDRLIIEFAGLKKIDISEAELRMRKALYMIYYNFIDFQSGKWVNFEDKEGAKEGFESFFYLVSESKRLDFERYKVETICDKLLKNKDIIRRFKYDSWFRERASLDIREVFHEITVCYY